MWQTHAPLDALHAHKDAGWLRCALHPTLPLSIWNYSDKCQFKQNWDDVTTQCRGLIVDTETHAIVGRGFPKFWNLTENRHISTPTFDVYEKLDGSLGILFHYRGKWEIASRGAFVSDQAVRASKILEQYDLTYLDTNASYVFEIIYPENRIVVDYGDRNELVLLAAFKNEGPEIYPLDRHHLSQCGFAICPAVPAADIQILITHNDPNAEGFVVRFENGHRVKIKCDWYLNLHFASKKCSAQKVMTQFQNRIPFERVLEDIPDEFHTWLQNTWDAMETEYAEIHAAANAVVDAHAHLASRAFAEAVKQTPYVHIAYAIRAGKDPHELIVRLMAKRDAATKPKFLKKD